MTRLWVHGDPVQVVAGPDGLPVRFLWCGAWHEVSMVANRWRVRSSWWLPEADVHREYVKLTTADRMLCTLFQDLKNGAWYLARLYD